MKDSTKKVFKVIEHGFAIVGFFCVVKKIVDTIISGQMPALVKRDEDDDFEDDDFFEEEDDDLFIDE